MLAQALKEFFQFVPFPHWVMAGTTLALLAQTFLAVLLWKRRVRWLLLEEQARQVHPLDAPKPRLVWLWLVFGASLILFLEPCRMAATTAINRVVTAPALPSMQERSAQYALGTSGQLTLHPVVISNGVLLCILASITAAFLIHETWRARRASAAAVLAQQDPSAAQARALSPLPSVDDVAAVLGSLFMLGLGPVFLGGFKQSTLFTRGYQSMFALPPEQRSQAMVDFLAQAQHTLDDISRWRVPGLVLAVALSLFALWPRERPEETVPAPADETWSWTWTIGIALACLALGGALLGLAAPFRAEAQTPLPLPANVPRVRLPLGGPVTPNLQGPDEVGLGPHLEMMHLQVLFEGEPVDDFALARSLRAALSPQQQRRGADPNYLNMVAETAVPMSILSSVLRKVRDAGYESVGFVFTEFEEHQRPILGQLRRTNATAATVWLTEAGPGDVVLRPGQFFEYRDFAKRIVELRRLGQRVNLDLAVKGY